MVRIILIICGLDLFRLFFFFINMLNIKLRKENSICFCLAGLEEVDLTCGIGFELIDYYFIC